MFKAEELISMGITHWGVITPSDVVFSDEVRRICEGNVCTNYGKTWAAVGNLMPTLERWFVIKKRNVEVECDFTASETLVTARLDLSITLGRLLSLVAVYGVRAVKEFLDFKKKRKGGAHK